MARISRRSALFTLAAPLLPAPTGAGGRPVQQDEVRVTIGDSIGSQPSIAVPDCLPLTSDRRRRRRAAPSPRCFGTIWTSSASSG